MLAIAAARPAIERVGESATHSPVTAGSVAVFLVIYLLPSIIAFVRRVPTRISAVVVNLLLGWTLIGWVIALAMASRSEPTSSVVTNTIVITPTAPPNPPLPHVDPSVDRHRW